MNIRVTTKYVYVKQTELLIEKYWKGSFDAQNSAIAFDFSGVEYMDLMQICQIFLWVEKLLIENKAVHLNFSKPIKSVGAEPSNLFFVVNSYGFFAQLGYYKSLSIEPNPVNFRNYSAGGRPDSPLIHLTLFDKQSSLDEFLANESLYESRYFGALKSSNSISTTLRTAVRNIILREIAGNVFFHAGKVPALLAVARKSKKQLASSRNPDPIREFASRSNVDDYIQIVVADFGVGIPAKLREAFKSDGDACRYFKNECASSIIEYSFWKDSSSRRRSIEEAIDEESALNDLVPPTGLYFVKQLVERMHGMISVRAADTLWASDYTVPRSPTVDSKKWGVNQFASIPGTLTQILLPIKPWQITLPLTGDRDEPVKRSIQFAACVSWNDATRLAQDEKEAVAILIRNTRTAMIEAKAGYGIVVNLNGKAISSKRQFQIAAYLMYSQDENRPIVLVNVSTDGAWAEVVRQLVGLDADKQRSLRSIRWFSTKEEGLIQIQEDSKYPWSISREEVDKYMLGIARASVESAIQATLHSEAKVFLPAPSSLYVRGFFHLPEILGDLAFCSNFVNLVAPMLRGQKFIAVVNTSSKLIDLGRSFAIELDFSTANVFYQASDRPQTAIMLDLLKLPREAVLVLSDAIVTGHTVSQVRKFIPQKSVVVALVAHPSQDDVISPVKHAFETFERKPKDWSYDEIRPISSATHQFVEVASIKREEHVSEGTFQQWADADKAVAIGHFSHERTCYLVFFDTYKMNNLYGHEIFEFIRLDLSTLRQNVELKAGLVFGCPANNIAAQAICAALKDHMGGKIEYVAKSGSISHDTSGKTQQFVFIDTAASTTRTIRRAMEYAFSKGYESLLVYIFINRSRLDEYEFVRGIDIFKGVEVRIRSQFRVVLPAFDGENGCPACQRKHRLEDEARKSIPSSCRSLLEEEVRRLKLVPIQEARNGTFDVSADSAGAYGKALEFRQEIERAGADDTMVSKSRLIALVNELAAINGGVSCLVDVLWLEADAIRRSSSHGRFWDVELTEILVDKCILELYRSGAISLSDRKAVWVAVGIDVKLFLENVDVDLWRLTEGACAALVSALLLYRDKSTDGRAVQLLRKVSTAVETTSQYAFSPITITALREAANFLEMEYIVEPHGSETFCEAVHTLGKVFYQKGSSHPLIRRIFDDARRLILPDDLETCLLHAKQNSESVFNIFGRELLPALKTFIKALPEEMLADSPYAAKLTVANDVNSFIADLEIAFTAHSKGLLSNDAWDRYKRSIQETTSRILKQFISMDTSDLQSLLFRCEADVREILKDIKANLALPNVNSLILRLNDVRAIVLPIDVARDLCRTIVENALLYGEEGSDVVCEVIEDSNMVMVETRSIAKKGHWPQKKLNHGLHRASETIERFGGSLRLPLRTSEMNRNIDVVMCFPIKWSLE
jgi:hypothetical protein